jgi:hypothetical protein
MKYTVYSMSMAKATPTARWITSRAWLFQIFLGVARVLATMSNLGVLFAPTVVFSSPLLCLFDAKTQLPLVIYWILVVVIFCIMLCLIGLMCRAFYRCFRQGMIFLEAISCFVGTVLAVVVVLWLRHRSSL